MEIKGKVFEVSNEIQVSEKFKKRELIIEYAENPTYPEYIKLEAVQDKTSLLDKVKVGQHVEVSFNLRGRAWTDKQGKASYFNTLSIWKINSLASSATPAMAQATVEDDDSSDLPF